MKIGWRLACTAATFALLGGCGGPASEDTDNAAGPSEIAEAAPASAEPATAESDIGAEEVEEAAPAALATSETPVTPKAVEAEVPTAPVKPPVAFMQCRSCHSIEPGKNGIGPSLHGIYGAKAAVADGFKFSPALKGSGITWDRASLDEWLAGPVKMVPGTRMILGVRNEEQRAAVIDYLETLK